jgi:hypothetical protein
MIHSGQPVADSTTLFNMLLDAERQSVVDALDGLEEPTIEKSRARATVKEIIGCSDEEAMTILDQLESSGLIRIDIFPPGGQLDQRKPVPHAGFKWTRAYP